MFFHNVGKAIAVQQLIQPGDQGGPVLGIEPVPVCHRELAHEREDGVVGEARLFALEPGPVTQDKVECAQAG